MMGSSAVTGIQTGPMQMSGMAGVAAGEDAERVVALRSARSAS